MGKTKFFSDCKTVQGVGVQSLSVGLLCRNAADALYWTQPVPAHPPQATAEPSAEAGAPWGKLL